MQRWAFVSAKVMLEHVAALGAGKRRKRVTCSILTVDRKVRLAIAVLLLVASPGCTRSATQYTASERVADERSLNDLDAAWSKAAANREPETVLTFLADDISIPFANGPTLSGKDAVRAWLNMVMANRGLDWHWQAIRVEVSRDGTMAYVTGTYQLSLTTDQGAQATDRGRYSTVWRKDPTGTWKAVLDSAATDLSPEEYVRFFRIFSSAFAPQP
jgi:uncharacterized protein (TIGR02246 family)